MRYVLAWILVVSTFVVVWRARADESNCHAEILAWCQTYPGPADTDCEKMARDECSKTPPTRAELCKVRAKRMCDGLPVDEHEPCIVARLQECKSP